MIWEGKILDLKVQNTLLVTDSTKSKPTGIILFYFCSLKIVQFWICYQNVEKESWIHKSTNSGRVDPSMRARMSQESNEKFA